jgi:hypothetical protein
VEYKYVGLLIDQNFEWDLHIITVINKLRSAMYQLRTLKPIVNENTLRTVYFSAVHPFILYGIMSYGYTKSGELSKLCKMQIRILKLMRKGSKFKSINEYFTHFNILPVKDLMKYAVLLENYFVDEHGVPRTHTYNTRTALNNPLFVPRSLNRFGERTKRCILPHLWNNLPNKYKILNNINIVKKKLKLYFLGQLH